jgi:Holliday junction resolvase RusA-like endonuclease
MNDLAKVDLFDTGRDPFSPVVLQAKHGAGNCELVAEIVPIANGAQRLLHVVVVGVPRPQGSKKAFYNAKIGRAMIVDDNDVKLRTWRQDVVTTTVAILKAERRAALAPRTALDVAITFMMPRPKGHWRSGRNAHLLRDDAPARPSTKPDIDKLARSTLDALRDAGVYVDDAQVVGLQARKIWATERVGAVIDVVVSA